MRFKFSGHQTFTFRYGWLEKGIRGLLDYPDLFERQDAPVLLGVGKNMVESIRHWCCVTQLIEENANRRKTGAPALKVTSIGEKLLRPRGWDPFIEDDASLWLIHWLLVSNPSIGTTWQIAFSWFQRADFTKRELLDYVAAFAEKHGAKVKESSLSRDIDCFIRTYTSGHSSNRQAVAEESFDCPLQELNLLHASPDGELYRFAVGHKHSLPTAVFAFALEQYFLAARVSGKTMGVQECLYGPGSPGQVFKLDENSLIAYVEDIEKTTRGKVSLDETAGLKQIYRHHEWESTKLLANYYATEARQ